MKIEIGNRHDINTIASKIVGDWHDVNEAIINIQNSDILYIITDDNSDIVGACGGYYTYEHVLTCWVLSIDKEYVKKNKGAFFKLIKELIDETFKSLIRIQCVVRCDIPQYVRFVEALGFEREALMKKYDGINDCYLYARVKNDS